MELLMHITHGHFTICSLLLIPMLLAAVTRSAAQTKEREIDIPYRKFVLDNGLTLIVHEDRKAPIVAVNVWYHVGSKNEKPGKSGFAHLFEHLMFNGSENFDDDYFQAMERIGATDLNGTTNEDRTNYFQNVPSSAVDVALWMESDRMGHLLGAITQKKLDEQRGVVQNEKRQGENQPYALSDELIVKATFPAGHPYSWTVIGSMEDLNAASLDDVKEWFKTYYGAANAVVVIAGDIDADVAYEKTKKYFGDIPPGPPVSRHDVWIAKRSGVQRQVAQDRVPQSRIYKVWNVPQWGSDDETYLDLAGDILASGKTSRLYKRLVYDDQIATDVAAFVDAREIAGHFYLIATAKPGVDLSKVEKAMDEELARFLKFGPTDKEVRRVKTQYEAQFVRGIERIGGFGGKSDILAQNQVYGGKPDFYKVTLDRVLKATKQNLLTSAREWLSDGVYVLEVHPYPSYSTASSTVDRTKLPETGIAPDVKFPSLQRSVLSNGLQIVFAERTSVPLVNFSLLADAGYAADQFGVPGTASLAMDMLDEGTKRRSSLQINEELNMLGATLRTGADLDMCSVSLSTLTTTLDEALEIYADVILNPSFPTDDFNRLKEIKVAQIQREKVTPVQMAMRVFPRFLYGEAHAYGNPFTGSGTEESVRKITRENLSQFHKTWFKPNNATLVVVGATTMNDIKPKLERLFKDWKRGDVPKKNITEVHHKEKPSVYLVDKPGSLQSIIFAGHVAPPKANPYEIGIEVFNDALGGSFTSRVNMNLREDKHWAYGAFTFMPGARAQRPFIAYAPVQTDKTKESMTEILKELTDVVSTRPITKEELTKVRDNRVLELPGSWETASAVVASISQIVRYGFPDDYYETYAQKIRSLSLDDMSTAAKHLVFPNKLVWIVVGDRSKIETGIRELGLGEIQFIDSDGNAVD
jgi:zinc protease